MAARREQLNRDRVLAAAVALADAEGVDAVSMRGLAQHLSVVPMALYKHVANKDELLDGMIDAVVGEIEPPVPGPDWRAAVRRRILSARTVLLRHPWARRVMESKTTPTLTVLGYMDSTIGMFLAGGLTVDLTHHVMHALGSRIFGFTQELYESTPAADLDWRETVRRRILSARTVLLRHPWARRVMEARTTPTPIVLAYMESTIGMLLAGGFSVDLVHHVMHALGSRIFGFTQELYDSAPAAEVPPEVAQFMMATFPHIFAVATSRPHDPGSVVGPGCDDQFEFEFTLDLFLDGIDRLHRLGWHS